MNRRYPRLATLDWTRRSQIINYHLSKLNRTVEPICPFCEPEKETVTWT